MIYEYGSSCSSDQGCALQPWSLLSVNWWNGFVRVLFSHLSLSPTNIDASIYHARFFSGKSWKHRQRRLLQPWPSTEMRPRHYVVQFVTSLVVVCLACATQEVLDGDAAEALRWFVIGRWQLHVASTHSVTIINRITSHLVMWRHTIVTL